MSADKRSTSSCTHVNVERAHFGQSGRKYLVARAADHEVLAHNILAIQKNNNNKKKKKSKHHINAM